VRACQLISERPDHCQDDNGEQEQHRDFVEPAIEQVASNIAPGGEVAQQLAAIEVIADEYRHQDQLHVQPALGAEPVQAVGGDEPDAEAHHQPQDRGHEAVQLAFQPGSFQIKLGYEALQPVYEVSDLFFCNREEAMRILNTADREITNLLKGIHALGPHVVVITDGPEGAYAFDGNEVWFMPPYPDPAPPVDRTGAGDSFASTFTCALALGKSVPEALQWAPINSASVVQHIGAQRGLLRRDELEAWLAKAPSHAVKVVAPLLPHLPDEKIYFKI